jgi:plasmid stabilization system protein ParE
MVYRHIFDPIAAEEYEDSFKWYEERSFVAADNFILAVEIAISAICANPYRYRNTYKNLREITIKKYPFNLIYFVDEDKKSITIISLFHHKRNPKIKYKKVSRKRK